MAEVKYAVLGSGSSANSYIFELDNMSFIIDNGFTCKEIFRRAGTLNFDLQKLKFILLTHTHQDHSRGVGELSRKLKVPVVMHKNLSRGTTKKLGIHSRFDIEPGKEYTLDSLKFVSFATSHDAENSLGFYFVLGGTHFTLLTDTGIIPEEVMPYVMKSQVLFLEANYDEKMLENGPYPSFLKQRIASDKGHLSNRASFDFLKMLDENTGPSTVYLCHLSDTNNSMDILTQLVEKLNSTWRRNIIICKKGEPVEGVNV